MNCVLDLFADEPVPASALIWSCSIEMISSQPDCVGCGAFGTGRTVKFLKNS